MASAVETQPGEGGALPVPARPHGLPAAWTLVRGTVVELFRDRVTGLAAEAAFWALLSLPPLALGVLGTLGYLHGVLGADTINDIRLEVLKAAQAVLAPHTVTTVVQPILNNVLTSGRAGVVSIGFLISLYSGSRAMNVYVDAITIAYELHGIRGIIRSRLVSFAIYLAGVVVGIAVLPLLVAGPKLVSRALSSTVVGILYWPVVAVVSTALLATLYHVAVPVRVPWRRTLPGAAVALALWLLGSYLLRLYLSTQVTGTSAYGQLGAVVAVLIWLYITALAVLVGAELNAEIDKLWPTPVTAAARSAGRANADIGARQSWLQRGSNGDVG
ncbi:MAG TPA: YihY/virulence factor BrkB family protein [Mycobacteriales bacterium]|nr:YihY/virulence factor BrkB family protein [Mycobacteriales bacterium]